MPKINLPKFKKLSKKQRMLALLSGVLIIATLVILITVISGNGNNATKGFLVLNSNKSFYLPNEKVLLSIGYVNPEGKAGCQDNFRILINGPKTKKLELSTKNGLVSKTAFCNEEGNPTNEPYYTANLTLADEGVYKIKLTNLDRKISTTKNIEVKNNQIVNVARRTALTLNLTKSFRYHTSLTVSSPNKDFKGQLIEQLPLSLNLVWQGAAKAEIGNGFRTIAWDLDMKAGETKEFLYEFNAPDTGTLSIVNLGKAKLIENGKKIFEELNFWHSATALQ